jgi:hypothetical protein
MYWILLALVIGAAGFEWNSRHPLGTKRRLHTSYFGVINKVEDSPTTPGQVLVSMGSVTVGRAVSNKGRTEDISMDVEANAQFLIPDIDQTREYCEGWAEEGDAVRIETILEGKRHVMFSATDQLGRGIVHCIPEFLSWGPRQ